MLTDTVDNYTEDLEKTGRRLFPIYLTILVISPFPLGANRPWAWSILAIVAFSLLAYYFLQTSRGKVRIPDINIKLKLVCFCLFLWVLYQIVLVVPLPIETVKLLSPMTIDALSSSGSLIASKEFISISIDKITSINELIKSSLYVCIFLLTILLVRSKDRLRNLFIAIVVAGVLQAVIGLTIAFLDQSVMRGVIGQEYHSAVSGTFVNRNHFAGFMNLTIAASIGLILSVGIREKRQIHRESHKHPWQSRLLDWRIYMMGYCLIMVFALLFSQSRGAWVSFSVMVVIGFMLLSLVRIKVFSVLDNYTMPILIVVGAILVGGADVLVNRMSDIGVHLTSRMDIWQNSWLLLLDSWQTGIGPGNFQYAYPIYASGYSHSLNVNIAHAHNDYLELLIEQGIVGFSLLGIVIFTSIRTALSSIKEERDVKKNAFAIASLLGISGLMVHSFLDFNFQIPSNSLYFFTLLAVACMQGLKSLHVEDRDIAWEESMFKDSISENSQVVSQANISHKRRKKHFN